MVNKSSLLFLIISILPFMKLNCCSQKVQESPSYLVEEVEIEDTTFLLPVLDYAMNNLPEAFVSFNTIDFFEKVNERNLFNLMINAHQKNTIEARRIKYYFDYQGIRFYMAEGVPDIYKLTGCTLQITDSDINTNYPEGFCFFCRYLPFQICSIALFGTFDDPSEAYDRAIIEKNNSIRVLHLQIEQNPTAQP